MRPITWRWLRVVLLGILIGVLGVPPEAFTARARQQQQGPTKPPATQPAQPPTPPTTQQEQEQKAQQQQNQSGQQPQVAITSVSNVVNIDATVTDSEGDLLRNLKAENFRVLDEGQPQQISHFSPSDAPITVVILMEFSRVGDFWGYFGYKSKWWAEGFLQHLNKQDWVAVKTFDLNTHLLVDFTHNVNEVDQAIESLFYPDFSESRMFDAVLETLDQLRDVPGKKSILLITTGLDTFSKHTLDQTYKRLKETDVPIFCVGMGEEIDLYSQATPISYLQAKNELTTFGNMTGGYAWFPRFAGEMPDIFSSIAAFLRSQYSIAFSPTTPQDGKYHKLKVEVLDEKGNELELADKKGRMKKVIVYARQGYTAPKAASGD
ncbi:MAG TPA: VWA domain-containing protein [Candidatus Acidoferrales bacterium]|nr:VWA domain-containing protein [Candidatus Acidoferrales bacterium]